MVAIDFSDSDYMISEINLYYTDFQFLQILLQTSGGTALYITGIFQWIAPNAPVILPFFLAVLNLFLISISFFGFVSQFIYRFLMLFRING